jgi:hypothetical protein
MKPIEFETKVLALLLTIFAVASFSSKTPANSSHSGTCNIGDVPTAVMAGIVAETGASSFFSVAISPTEVTPEQDHIIVITRTSGSLRFRGLLLYVEDSSMPTPNRIGSLSTIGGASAAGLTCPGNANALSTLTHTVTSSFSAIQQFNWAAPASITGPITINAIAYEERTRWNVPTPLTGAVLPPRLPR